MTIPDDDDVFFSAEAIAARQVAYMQRLAIDPHYGDDFNADDDDDDDDDDID